ncbi:Ig-like domain-containing protein [Aquimarina sp. SS2-1]|uniref:Ig-like domain-containing protein n=1 Tax=Aquimarina besae TaxID=3342247 RepID=UPI00366F79D3
MKNYIIENIKISRLLLCMSLFFFGLSGTAQVELIEEVKISDSGLYFDGSKVPESERLTFPNRAKYDYAFGRKITPHGDCIYKHNEYVFMTWYKGGESDRHVMLSRYNTITKKTVTIQFPHRHTGFQNRPHIGESHNTIAVGVAPVDGTVHLLYDMHAYSRNRPSNGSLSNDYFRYSYSKKNVATLPDSEFTLDKFFPKRLYLKSGDNYEGLTYPKFFNNEAGDLFVSMREGGHTNGKYMTAKYNGTSWSSFKDFNVLDARSKGINYNWGLYGDFKFINGKMHVGFHTRKSINNDKFSLNSGFYYAYANNSTDISDWRDHKNRRVATPLIDPEEIFISEPGNEVNSSGANSVRITSGADWTVTKDGSIHFRTTVTGSNGSRNVHTYKKAGEANFRTTTNFPGGDFHSIENDVYMVGLRSGRPVIYRADAGTNNWETLYTTNSGRTFKHGVVHIKDGRLYYYLMENKTGSAQPIYLQIYDLGINSENNPPTVSLTNPSENNQEYTLGETITLRANASDQEGSVDRVNFKINGSFFRQDRTAPYSITWTPTAAGTYIIGARAFEEGQEGLSTEVSRTVIIKEEINNQSPVVSLTNPSENNQEFTLGETITLRATASDQEGNVDRVNFKINGSFFRLDRTAPYSVTWTPTVAGTYTIGARAFEEGQEGLSTEVSRTVIINEETSNQAPQISFATPSGNITAQEGYDLVVRVNASDPDGSISNVKLYINNELIRQESFAPYEWGHDRSPNPQEVNNRSAGVHTFKAIATDNEGKQGQATFTLTVNGTNMNSVNNCSFGTPINTGLSAMNNISYSKVYILGNGGPNLDNFKELSINWNPQHNGLYQFAINTTDGSPDWYVDFKNTMTFQLKNANPEVTLNNTGFAGLDGSYWVTRNGDDFIMVSKTKDFALYFSNSSEQVSCRDRSNDAEVSKETAIIAFPNPVNNNILNISGMKEGLSTIEITDMFGKTIYSQTETSNKAQLNVTHLSTGSYILIVKSLKSRKAILFTKQ